MIDPENESASVHVWQTINKGAWPHVKRVDKESDAQILARRIRAANNIREQAKREEMDGWMPEADGPIRGAVIGLWVTAFFAMVIWAAVEIWKASVK